jgi:hypothetical protein
MPDTERQIEAMESNSAGAERRAWVRYPCDVEGSCQALMAARGLQWVAKVRNLSRGGMALTLRRRFEMGTLLAIEVQGRSAKSPSTLMGRVAHVTAMSDGTWLLGCAFSSELSEQELQALL